MPITPCPICKGSGWDNAARAMNMEDAPIMDRPLGVFTCRKCCGSGQVGYLRFDELSKEEQDKQLKDFMEKMKPVHDSHYNFGRTR